MSKGKKNPAVPAVVPPVAKSVHAAKEVLETIPRKTVPQKGMGAPRQRNEAIHYSDGTTELILLRKNGFRIVCTIDTQDYPTVEHFCWSPWSSPDSDTRALTKIGKRTLYIHQLLCPGMDGVDHINRNPLDNTRGNLRPATRSIQGQNQKKRRTGLTSKFIGVYW